VIALRNLNSQQIEAAEKELKRTVKWFAWGLVAVGCIGSCGGILLGYGVARALRHSIYQLSVRIRDAADKLGHDLPTVTITQGDGIAHLHEQMQSVLREIEQMSNACSNVSARCFAPSRWRRSASSPRASPTSCATR